MTKPQIDDANYLREVREQYENYPYPPRDPGLEKKSIRFMYASALDCMNYYHFGGTRDFSKGFRALVAGGGTGDGTIMLAEQLRGMEGEVVYLDISQASMQVAQERANMRQLDNITWVHGSILDAPKLLEGKFDHIDCMGVLHHLQSPEAGLAALASVLKDDGVMAIMLYAKYGREGVYQIQNLMRVLNQGEKNMQRKVENCKTVLKNLPKTSGFKDVENLVADVRNFGDVGIYDLFLHSNDVAYSIPDVYAFLATSGLKPSHFFFDQHTEAGNDLYRLESYFPDDGLSELMAGMSLPQKQAAAELMFGKIIKHVFYASRRLPSMPSLSDLDNVPFLSMLLTRADYNVICNLSKDFSLGQTISIQSKGRTVRFIKTTNTEHILHALDGDKSLRDIFKEVRSSYAANEKAPSIGDLEKEFAAIFAAFSLQDWMFLKSKSVPRSQSIYEIQARMSDTNAPMKSLAQA